MNSCVLPIMTGMIRNLIKFKHSVKTHKLFTPHVKLDCVSCHLVILVWVFCCVAVLSDKVVWVRACCEAHRLLLLPVFESWMFSLSSLCSPKGSVTLLFHGCPVTCKIGLKSNVCPRITDPRPRHAFPETGCAINIWTIDVSSIH